MRVRALLITPDGGLMTIRRVRPGQDPYWVLPGGGVENGEGLEAALERELREEVAADAEIHSLIYILEHGGDRQYFYLARARSWSASAGDRSGPEFTDPTRGEYHLQRSWNSNWYWCRNGWYSSGNKHWNCSNHSRCGRDQ